MSCGRAKGVGADLHRVCDIDRVEDIGSTNYWVEVVLKPSSRQFGFDTGDGSLRPSGPQYRRAQSPAEQGRGQRRPPTSSHNRRGWKR
jgi:hypothetical protein